MILVLRTSRAPDLLRNRFHNEREIAIWLHRSVFSEMIESDFHIRILGVNLMALKRVMFSTEKLKITKSAETNHL